MNQLLKLTDPVESVPAEDLVELATATQASKETVFKSRVIDGNQEQVQAQQNIGVDALSRMGTTPQVGKSCPMASKPFGVVKTFPPKATPETAVMPL